ncbi:MAG TPA: restriction endonuclease subunit S, partial [Gemmatimonadaceae bacterium]|jgi:type I restriction enzyme S subunit
MGSEWEARLVLDLVEQGTLAIGDGYRAKNSDLCEEGLPFARAGNLNARFDFAGADRMPYEKLAQVRDKCSEVGDVVFTSKGTVGRVGYVSESVEPFVYSPQLCFWRSYDSDRLVPQFLYYWFHGDDCRRQIAVLKGQTDMADYVSLRDQRSMRIMLPPAREQEVIAGVLGAIDAKIESNMCASAAAEAAVAARFACWRGGSQGASESLTSVARFVNGRNFTKDAAEGGRIVLRIKELNGGSSKSTVRSNACPSDDHVAYPGDLLFAWSGTLGVHRWFGPESIVNQHIFKVIPSGYPVWFVEQWLLAHIDQFRRIALDKATTMGHIKRGDVDAAAVVVPTVEEFRELRVLCDPLDALRSALAYESSTLTSIREVLLPKLISGQIRVPLSNDPEEQVGAAVEALSVT